MLGKRSIHSVKLLLYIAAFWRKEVLILNKRDGRRRLYYSPPPPPLRSSILTLCSRVSLPSCCISGLNFVVLLSQHHCAVAVRFHYLWTDTGPTRWKSTINPLRTWHHHWSQKVFRLTSKFDVKSGFFVDKLWCHYIDIHVWLKGICK